MACTMKRAVIGVPSKCSTRTSRAGSTSSSLTSRLRICASRFCSTTNTRSCGQEFDHAPGKRKGAQPQGVEVMPRASSTCSASCIDGLVEPK
jgi:hypothetical protein